MGYDALGKYDGIPDDAGALTAPSTPPSQNAPGTVVTGDAAKNAPPTDQTNNAANNPSGSPAQLPGLTDQKKGVNLSQFTAAESNPLDKYATFNCLFTLACLNPGQQNGGKFDPSSLKNVIISSKGEWDKNNRATTIFGQYDYFIDDLIIVNTATPNSKTGSTFATKLTFKVIEPYSMGLFILALNEGSIASGYKNFREAPYLLMIEFAGHDQAGNSEINPNLTRYIPIKFLKINFKVTQAGSIYECEAIPYNHVALQDKQSTVTSDVTLRGTKVSDLIAGANDSLLSQVKRHYEELVTKKIVTAYDQVDIHFPKDFQDPGNTGNEIGNSVLFKDLNDNGTVQFPSNDKMFDTVKQIYTNSKLKVSPEKNLTFSQNLKIEDIISEVVMRSDYIAKQLLQGSIKVDENGMMNWFRIETRVMDLGDNPSLGRQNRKLIYRVVPYKVQIDKFLPPNTKPPGYDNLKKTVSRVYNYIYTGLNTEILSVDLDFQMSFFANLPADATGRTAQNNTNQGGPGAGGQEPIPTVKPESTSNTDTEAGDSVGLTADPRNQTDTGGTGSDGSETRKTKTMNALLANVGEMIELKLTIMGDPYYVTSSGMGNQIVPQASFNKLKDGSMNIQSGQLDFVINFRTPVDLDPPTGLYKFEKSIDMWSGLYVLLDIESKFSHNKFTQVLRGSRRRQQVSGSGPIVPILGS